MYFARRFDSIIERSVDALAAWTAAKLCQPSCLLP
jgi:hypothetical protein